ncbi:hypothetical protein CWB99_01245 [Pseudoalteromonas rubra]|uniref:Pullulanase n=1 Tax=Pseudoalteromonas rubra TaxID=43658 RepID=A0A5S3WUX6_9GAMM|nr:hypothetical protein [Pseudoalteromonas rubra]TMP28085.1 hypothetical protein CWC00_21970 [Pseudoalteromonas rubra]TMP32749.1 hypothetical protein CWB99_01245 [Pseudoalteromonas rubra]
MKKLIFLTALFIGISSSNASEINPKDLIEIWGNSEDGGKTFWGYDQYFADGSLKSWGQIPETPVKYKLEGTYQVKHKFKLSSCLTISKTSHPEFIPTGTHWCDEIIKLNDKVFTFKSSNGKMTTLYRQNPK